MPLCDALDCVHLHDEGLHRGLLPRRGPSVRPAPLACHRSSCLSVQSIWMRSITRSFLRKCKPPACHEIPVATKDRSGRTQCQAKKTGNNEKTLAKATVVLLTGVSLMMSQGRTQGARTGAGTPTPTMTNSSCFFCGGTPPDTVPFSRLGHRESCQ